jgi:hypothetical protein
LTWSASSVGHLIEEAVRNCVWIDAFGDVVMGDSCVVTLSSKAAVRRGSEA